MVVVGAGLVGLAMWLRHGGLARDPLTGIGELAALGGTFLALVGILLASRAPWLDQVVGSDRLLVVHRWLGFSVISLLSIHGVLSTLAFAQGSSSSFTDELGLLISTIPGMLGAVVALALFGLVTMVSLRYARARVSYETWHGIHLYIYLALALAFLHQLTIGTDFVNDPLAQAFWIGLYVAALLPLAWYRWITPGRLFVRYRFRVAAVAEETTGVVSVYINGRDLARLPVRSGQWFRLRFLTADRWWRAHPFSLSAAPDGQALRFTIKAAGDSSGSAGQIKPGTSVMLEGPYGILHGGIRKHDNVLLIAGGVGITPLRALLESLSAKPGQIALLYRVRGQEEILFRAELDGLARHRGAQVHYLSGPRGTDLESDPLGPVSIGRLVPDVCKRDVYLCGPLGLMDLATGSLALLGVPAEQIHAERFEF